MVVTFDVEGYVENGLCISMIGRFKDRLCQTDPHSMLNKQWAYKHVYLGSIAGQDRNSPFPPKENNNKHKTTTIIE